MDNNKNPLVSIICLCYNHGSFVLEAMNSVLEQDYPNIEFIVMDDRSEDNSAEIIEAFCKPKGITYILNERNLGNCAAFNRAFSLCSGEFIIDFAADDILLSSRVRTGLKDLETKGMEYGVHFSDAMLIDENANELGLHSRLTKTIDPGEVIPEGDVFNEVLARYFICPPTIMARREVFEYLEGYDESLTFEDFDFLVRSSRKYKFCYSPEALVKRRIVKSSKSQQQYRKGSKDLNSVLAVCRNALPLVRNKKERKALNIRLQYECRQAIIYNQPEIVEGYIELMKKNKLSRINRELYRITSHIYPNIFQ